MFNFLLYVSKFYSIRMIALLSSRNENNIDLENRRLINENSVVAEENYHTSPSHRPGPTIENATPGNQNMYPSLNNIYEND